MLGMKTPRIPTSAMILYLAHQARTWKIRGLTFVEPIHRAMVARGPPCESKPHLPSGLALHPGKDSSPGCVNRIGLVIVV